MRNLNILYSQNMCSKQKYFHSIDNSLTLVFCFLDLKRDIYVKQLGEIRQFTNVQRFQKFKIIPKNWCLCLKASAAVDLFGYCLHLLGWSSNCDMGFCLYGFVYCWFGLKLKSTIYFFFSVLILLPT